MFCCYGLGFSVKKYNFNYFWNMETDGIQPYQGETFYKCNFEKVSFLHFFLLSKANLPLETSYLPMVRLNTSSCLRLWVTVAFLVQGIQAYGLLPSSWLSVFRPRSYTSPLQNKKKKSCIYFKQFVTGFELKTDFALFPLQRTPATESCPTAKAG